MKKTIISMILAACALQSCNLDLIPENTVTYTNAFTTENELRTMTASIHYYTNIYIKDNQTLFAAGAKADTTQGDNDIRRWNPNAITSAANDWKTLYDIIFMSNMLIDNIHRTENLPADRYNYHSGQAQFAMGLSYFLLAQRYGSAIITENSETIKMYGNSTQIEVLDAAIKHAEEAFALLPTIEKMTDLDGRSTTNRQYASKGTCAALLAHIYAWKGSVIQLYGLEGNANECYQKSIDYTNQLTTGKAGNYQLMESPEALCEAFSSPSTVNPEIIFSMTFDKARDKYTVSPNMPGVAYTGWPVDKTKTMGNIVSETSYLLKKETTDRMYPDEDDLRRNAFFYKYDEEHVVDETPYAIFHKFRNGVYDENSGSEFGIEYRTLDSDYNYWRLADLILLRAECQAKLGKDQEAIADLNKIRERANAQPYPAAQDTEGLQKAIFRERERELIGETDGRYFDVIRNNYIKTELIGKFQTLTKADIKNGALFLPIPTSAILDSDGQKINTKIRQHAYWIPYM